MSAGYLDKCGRKRRFPNRQAADGARRAITDAGLWTWRSSRSYLCNQCKGYHVGHASSARKGQQKGRRSRR